MNRYHNQEVIKDAVGEIMSFNIDRINNILKELEVQRQGAKNLVESISDYTAPEVVKARQETLNYYNDLIERLNNEIKKPSFTHFEKYGNITKIEKLPVPPTYEEFLKEEEFSIQWLGSIVLYEDDKKTIYFSSKNHILELPNTEENYYKCLDKLVELWRA